MSELETLIEKFRSIANTASPREKAEILRQILALDNTIGWRDALADAENAVSRELDIAARQAVADRDMPALQKILDELQETKWFIQINPVMIKKISAMLDKHYREQEAATANKLLAAVNDAYSALDFTELSAALEEWDNFTGECDYYTPDAATGSQIAEAREYFSIRKKEWDAELLYSETLEELRTGLLDEKPLGQMEKCVNTIRSMDREIPENIWRQFISYKEDIENIRKRRKLIKTVIFSLATVVLLAGIGTGVFFIVMEKRENAWVERLSASLENDPAENTLALLNDLEQQSPMLRSRPAIMELQHKAEIKKEEEKVKRENFKTLAAEMQEKMLKFGEHVSIIGKIKEQLADFIVDDVEKAEYERLCAEYDQRKMVYDTRQNQLYRRQMGVMEKQIAMFTAAIEAENIETAEKALEKAKAVKAELEAIPGADPALMQKGSKLAARLPDMEWRLKNAVKAIANYRRARTQLLDSRTFPDFSSNLELFSLHVPAVRAEFRNDIKKFKDGELAVANSAYEENLENIPVFKEDVRTLNSIVNARKQLQRELRQVLTRELTKITAADLKMIVLGNPFGDMCTLLFDRAQQKVNIGSKRQVELHCMTDLSGAYENLILSYNTQTGESSIMRPGNDIALFRGKMLYPAEYSINEPFIVAREWQTVLNELDKTENPEEIILKTARKMNSDPAVNPPCAFWILNLMITRLPDINKAYYADTIARWQEAAKAIDINKLLLINKNNDLTETRAKLDMCISNMPGVYRNNDFIALNAAVSRKLKPAGFVISEADGKIIWRRFNDAPVSGEAWILDDRGGFIVAGSYQNTALKAKISVPAFAKLVFTPTDGRSTVALQNELLLEKSGITLPGSWPIIIQ